MSSELEARLRRALDRLPGAGPDVEHRARRSALEALPASPPTPLRRRRGLLLAAACLAAFLTGGATFAATGRLVPLVGGESKPHPRPAAHTEPRGPLPPGASGFATFVGGRLWLATPGARVAGHPANAVEVSPNALFVALGEPHRLVVKTPNMATTMWAHRTAGPVVAIAWSPFPTQIAYVVRTPAGGRLHVIEADGDHDRLIGPAAPVSPSWRWDSLAIAYVTPRGRAAVIDFRHGTNRVIPVQRACSGGRVARIAFAPEGNLVAGAIPSGMAFVASAPGERGRCIDTTASVAPGFVPPPLLAWLGPRRLVTVTFTDVWLHEIGRTITTTGRWIAPSIDGLTVSPDRRRLAVAVNGTGTRVFTADLPGAGGRLMLGQMLLSLAGNFPRAQLYWR